MTREEAIRLLDLNREYLKNTNNIGLKGDIEALEMAIKALEQDTVPFDFELYQAGLMDLPKGMIDVLNEIRAEIEHIEISRKISEHTAFISTGEQVKQIALDIIDKYRTESEDKG